SCKGRKLGGVAPPNNPRHDILEQFLVHRAEIQHLTGVAQDVALEDVVRVIRQILRERTAKSTKERVPVSHPCGTRARAYPEVSRPRVAQERFVRRGRQLAGASC